jgi:hypothetical protein
MVFFSDRYETSLTLAFILLCLDIFRFIDYFIDFRTCNNEKRDEKPDVNSKTIETEHTNNEHEINLENHSELGKQNFETEKTALSDFLNCEIEKENLGVPKKQKMKSRKQK